VSTKQKNKHINLKTEQEDKLKDANKKLRGNVKQLRKELRIANETIEMLRDELSGEEGEIIIDNPSSYKLPNSEQKCPKCNNETIEFKAGIHTIRKCSQTECGWRKRI